MTEWPTAADDEQQAIERLLRAASPRVEPPADVERELRAKLRAEWRGIVSAARARRRHMTLSLAAGVALVAVGAGLATSMLREPAPVIAIAAVAHGELRVADSWIGRWRPLADGAALRVGQRLATGPQTRGALRLTNGLSLRLDHATRVALGDIGHVGIEQGALYVDTGAAGSPAADLLVATPAGDVRHVGTQYEVRLAGRDVTVRVREGRVELLRQDEILAEGRAGEQLAIDPAGRLSRSETAIHGPSWDWVAATAPSFDIDGRALPDFLAWAGRELGLRIDYATPGIEAAAARVRLSGSVAGLMPDQALQAVMDTTRLRAQLDGGRVVILPGAGTD